MYRFLKLIELPYIIKMKPYLVHNSKFTSQAKTVCILSMQYICAIFSFEYWLWILIDNSTWEGINYIIKRLWIYVYVFSIIAYCLIYLQFKPNQSHTGRSNIKPLLEIHACNNPSAHIFQTLFQHVWSILITPTRNASSHHVGHIATQ